MMLYAHIVWLAALQVMGCGPDGDEMHRLLLGLAPVTVGFAFLLRMTRPLAEVHSMLRWLAVPLALLLPFVIRSIWRVFQAVSVDSLALCSSGVPPPWQAWWAPIQVLTLLLVSFAVANVWRSVKIDKDQN